MMRTSLTAIAALAIAPAMTLAIALAPPAHADRDTAFAEELHTYGIYGQRDFNAWLAKIMCKRLHKGVDSSAYDSAEFLHSNLDLDTTETQAWQFLNSAMNFYCPENRHYLDSVATAQRD